MSLIQVRRGTSVEWDDADTVLAEGEFGYETNTGKIKVGDGTTAWTGLDYLSADWLTLSGKPAVIASGATKAEARAAIDAASLDANGHIPLSEWGAQVVDGGGADATPVETLDGGSA